MGTLLAKHYPTKVFLGLADHAYVECGTQAVGWGCWGGKTGGTVLRSAPGSTNRANSIAQPDERANIKCYAINGVCHQAANRILLPAGITVEGVKGYSVSSALYGTYGLTSGPFGICPSPFHKYPDVSGDLDACALESKSIESAPGKETPEYLNEVLAIYEKAEKAGLLGAEKQFSTEEHVAFFKELFASMAQNKLKGAFEKISKNILDVRSRTERDKIKLIELYTKNEIKIKEYAENFDKMTIKFQDEMANCLSENEYKQLFTIAPGDKVTILDLDIIEKIADSNS